MCYGIIATLMLINAKLDDDLNANRSKPVSAIWASWTLSYLVKYDMYLCLALSFMLEKSRMGNRSRLDWRLSWWVLGLVFTSWRPYWSFRKSYLSSYYIYVWDYVMNIYSLCNKHCDGTIYNLSTYVCDRSRGAHKTFIHPLLFLKLGVTENPTLIKEKKII